MLLLKLAFLNIGRNPRRSLITIVAIAVGLAALIFLRAFMYGSQEEQRDNAVRLFTGHLQIHVQGFEKRLAPELTLPTSNEITQLLQAQSGLVAISERVKTEALVGTTENSRGVLLLGIDLEKEPNVTDVKTHVKEGAFLTGEGKEILIGYKLAEKLEAGLGDKVVVMTQALDGTLAGYAYRIKGIVRSGALALDELSAIITIDSARELLGLENKESHEIIVRLENREILPRFVSKLKQKVDLNTYEILTWDQIVPEINQWASWSDAIVSTMLIAVIIVISVGIMNTILMSIFERTRELGVMMAIGTAPNQIILLIFFETLILEIIGIGLGFLAGYSMDTYFGTHGIHFSGFEHAFAESFMSSVIRPRLKAAHVMESVGTLLAVTSFIGLYPAWRASRMEPVKAIYHS